MGCNRQSEKYIWLLEHLFMHDIKTPFESYIFFFNLKSYNVKKSFVDMVQVSSLPQLNVLCKNYSTVNSITSLSRYNWYQLKCCYNLHELLLNRYSNVKFHYISWTGMIVIKKNEMEETVYCNSPTF